MKDPVQSVVVHPLERDLSGTVAVPGDKSISHRLALLLPLAAGKSTLRDFLRSEDTLATLHAMGKLGPRVRLGAGGEDEMYLEGSAGRLRTPGEPLDLGNSGTGFRLMTGLLAGTTIEAVLTGDPSLRSRPMNRIRDPLLQMGANIEWCGDRPGYAPIRVRGRPLHGMRYTLPVASAQVKSAILLAGLFAEGVTTVIEPIPTRDHTERVFRAMGIPLRVEGAEISLEGFGPNGPSLQGSAWRVPGDFSSSSFWLVAAAARSGARVTIRNVGLNPRRTALLDILARMGARIKARPSAGSDSSTWEPVGDVAVTGGELRGTRIGGVEIPNAIDELPALSVAGALAEGETRICDAAELRVKESDRIAAIAENLRRAGVEVKEYPDGLSVRGPARIEGGVEFVSRGDHRVAMACAVLSLFGKRPSRIEDVACVATSYPGFWSDLEQLGGRATWE